jgi:hypothetical protein
MIRAVTSMRRGPGKSYLVYGRMQKPVMAAGVDTVRWEYEGKERSIPAVFHEAWESQDGRFAVALANWTDRPRTVRLRDQRFGERVVVHVAGHVLSHRESRIRGGALSVSVPSLGMVIAEQA